MRDPEKVAVYISNWMKEMSLSAGAKGGVFGVSGGVDSSLLVGLAKRAWGDNCMGLVLPCHSQAKDVEDAIDAVSYTHLDVYKRQVLEEESGCQLRGFILYHPEKANPFLVK